MSERTTRRHFLKVAGLAAAAPIFVPGAALGRGFRSAASDRITLGMIGVGNMGGGHVGAFLGNRDVQIVALSDVSRDRRERARRRVEEHYGAEKESGKFHGCDTYNEFETLLERADIDAVVIAVPDHWHAMVAIAACRAGKDVYCEKPLSLTIREARAMARTARQYARVFQTGSQQRSSSNFRLACELVRSERIGKLLTVNVGVGDPSTDRYYPEQPIPEGFDWERWLGPAPWAPYNSERCSGNYGGGWRRVRDYSGGMTTDWGAHHFDIGQWGMGMDRNGPVRILPPGLSEHGNMTYIYENGVQMIRGGANGILFTGTDGKIEVNRGRFRTWPEEIGKVPIGAGDVKLYESPGHRQDWIRCIRNRKQPICDVEIGASSIIVCHLGNIACWLEREIRWDPEREVIVGDETASRWLDRPKRAPWRLYA